MGPIRVLIMGAGLDGLLANVLLRRLGCETVFCERAEDFSRGGYVLALWRLGVRPLESVGLGPALQLASRVVESYTIADDRGVPLRTMSLKGLNARHGPIVQLHRSRLHALLHELPENRDVRMGTSVVALEQEAGGIKVRFNNGAPVERFDLVIGADGIRSAVRRLAMPEDAAPRPFGAIGWAFLAPAGPDTPDGIVELWSRSKYVGVYRFAEDRCGVYCALRDPQAALEPDDDKRLSLLRRAFSDFGGYVPALFAQLPPADEVFHDTLAEVKVNHFAAQRVALLGDAAHAMLPFGGMGASMAFEDGVVLAEELGRMLGGTGDLALALRRYERRRRFRVQSIQFNAWLKGLAMLRADWLPLAWRTATAISADPLRHYDSYQERVLHMLLASKP